MRTVGTFRDIYRQARAYLNDVSGLPTDPVVRLESDGKWILESRLEPREQTVVEVSLEDFQSYWYYSFENDEYIPTEKDVGDYIKFVEETQI